MTFTEQQIEAAAQAFAEAYFGRRVNSAGRRTVLAAMRIALAAIARPPKSVNDVMVQR